MALVRQRTLYRMNYACTSPVSFDQLWILILPVSVPSVPSCMDNEMEAARTPTRRGLRDRSSSPEASESMSAQRTKSERFVIRQQSGSEIALGIKSKNGASWSVSSTLGRLLGGESHVRQREFGQTLGSSPTGLQCDTRMRPKLHTP